MNNHSFQDNYLKEYPHDISKIWNIFCMNSKDTIDPAFRDRLDIIEVNPYNAKDKREIFKHYMLPKALENIGMNKKDVTITDPAIDRLIFNIDNSQGLRDIEKFIKIIVSRVNMYKRVYLSNGTLGELKFPYKINNFKLPLRLNVKNIIELTKDLIFYNDTTYIN